MSTNQKSLQKTQIWSSEQYTAVMIALSSLEKGIQILLGLANVIIVSRLVYQGLKQ